MISNFIVHSIDYFLLPIIIPIITTLITISLKGNSYYKMQIPVLKTYVYGKLSMEKKAIYVRLNFEGESLEKRCYHIDATDIHEEDILFVFKKRNNTEDIFSLQTIISKDVSINIIDDVIPKNEVLNDDTVFVTNKRFMPLSVYATYIERKVKYIVTDTGNCIGKHTK